MNIHKTLPQNIQSSLKDIEALADDSQESNNQGSGKFYYEHLLGKPKDCQQYKHVKIDGSVKITEDGGSLGAEWTATPISGIKELCPSSGKGCTVYSCASTQ